jgi:anhydro-N-acetylmuramic acid kinase
VIAAGIMSGTSADGIDAVVLDLRSISEPHEPEVVAHAYRPYPDALRARLLSPETLTVREIAELDVVLAERYAEVVGDLGVRRIDVVGLHGQTIFHAPPSSGARVATTLQIGSSGVLAARLGVPVVANMRIADVALGGEGAPLVPFTHWFFTPAAERPRVVVNVGGIANATFAAEAAEDVLGFDLGPGMMILDAWAARATGGASQCDLDGHLSAAGKVVGEILDAIVSHPFVAQAPPKSTGREAFGEAFFVPRFSAWAAHDARDVARSICAATAECIARGVRDLARPGSTLLVTGGGAKNPTLLRELEARLPDRVITRPARGVFAAEHHEPAAMALIAARTLAGLPSSLPRVTGAKRAAVLGHIHFPP